MARGKAPESEALKNAVVAYEALNCEDKVFFRNKLLSKLCKGIDKASRDGFKKEFNDMLVKIEKARKAYEQLQAVNELSIEELEKLLEAKKNNQK